MARNRIDFKLSHGTYWGTPTKTLLTNVLREIQKDGSVELLFPYDSLEILQTHLNFTKEHEAIRACYLDNYAHTFHESVCEYEPALILELSNFLKTTSFVVRKEIDEF